MIYVAVFVLLIVSVFGAAVVVAFAKEIGRAIIELIAGLVILAAIIAPFYIAATVYEMNVWPAVVVLTVALYFYGKWKEGKEK